MGSFSPVPGFEAEHAEVLAPAVHQPIVDELKRRGTPFHGVLYAGLMMTAAGPKVLEYNARFGDPETQAVLPRLRSDVLELLEGSTRPGGLDGRDARVVATMGGHGGAGLARLPGVLVEGRRDRGAERATARSTWRCCTPAPRERDGAVVTAGGRVLNVTGLGDDPGEARDRAYDAAEQISFDGMQMRRDIAAAAAEKVQA